MEMSLLLHRGIWQHHRVIAIKIKFGFKSLVRNYELKSGTMGLEFRDLEEVNVSWSRSNVNVASGGSAAGAASRMLPDGAGGPQAMGWPRGHQGQGTCPRLLGGVGRSLGCTRWRGGGWTWLSWPRASLRCAARQNTPWWDGDSLAPRDGMEPTTSRAPHPCCGCSWQQCGTAVPLPPHKCPPALAGWQHRGKRSRCPIWVFPCVCHGIQKQQGLSPAMQLELPWQWA